MFMRRKPLVSVFAVLVAVAMLLGAAAVVAQTAPAEHKSGKKKPHPIDESSTAAPRGENGVAVEGTVLSVNNKPAKGAEVVLTGADDDKQRWTTKSDGSGRFRFEGVLTPGHYLATATSENLASASTMVSVPSKKAVALQLKLRPGSEANGNK